MGSGNDFAQNRASFATKAPTDSFYSTIILQKSEREESTMNNKKKIVLVVMVLAIFVTCFLTGSFNEDCTIPYKATATVSASSSFSQLMKADKKKDAEITIKPQTSGVYFLVTQARNSKVDKSYYTYSVSGGLFNKPDKEEYSEGSNTRFVVAVRLKAGDSYKWEFRNKKLYSQYDVQIYYGYQGYETTYDNAGRIDSMVWVNQFSKDEDAAWQNVLTAYVNGRDENRLQRFLRDYQNKIDSKKNWKNYISTVGWGMLQIAFDEVIGKIPGASAMTAVAEWVTDVYNTPETDNRDNMLYQYLEARASHEAQFDQWNLNPDDYGMKVSVYYNQNTKKYDVQIEWIYDKKGSAPQVITGVNGNAGFAFYI